MPTSKNTTVVTNTKTTITTTVTPPNNSNNNRKAIGTAIAIFLITGALFWAFFEVFNMVEENNSTMSVFWNNEDSINVQAGPSWFYYDEKKDTIKSARPITDLDKANLLNLVKGAEDSSNSYKNAISELSFISNNQTRRSYLYILTLTAVCGAIGVQLRTINNFIGVTCFKNDFNFDIWWPWYFVRPLMGCLIGPVIFIIFDGNLLPMTTQFNYSNVLVIAVSILAGFGAEDVLNTLRTVSKRVWGYKEVKE
jgi:hypothetical protein